MHTKHTKCAHKPIILCASEVRNCLRHKEYYTHNYFYKLCLQILATKHLRTGGLRITLLISLAQINSSTHSVSWV